MGKNNRNPDLVCENMSTVKWSSDMHSHSKNSKFDLRFVIAVFPDHTHLLFLIIQTLITHLCRFKLDIFIILSDKKKSVLYTLWALKRTILLKQLF